MESFDQGFTPLNADSGAIADASPSLPMYFTTTPTTASPQAITGPLTTPSSPTALSPATGELTEHPEPMLASAVAPELSVSVSKPAPSPTATMIAELNGVDVGVVEANIAAVREAHARGDTPKAEEALLEQAALLNALGLKLIRVGGDEKQMARVQVFVGLGLRALEQERKTLATLASLRAAPPTGPTTNVQVNLGNSTKELKVVS